MTVVQFKYKQRLNMDGYPNSKRLVGKCPFHNDIDKSTDFVIDYHINSYYCTTCDKAGYIKDLEKDYKIVTEIREDNETLFKLLAIKDMLEDIDNDGDDGYWC